MYSAAMHTDQLLREARQYIAQLEQAIRDADAWVGESEGNGLLFFCTQNESPSEAVIKDVLARP